MKTFSQLTREQQDQVLVQWSGYQVNDYLYEIGNDKFVLSRRRMRAANKAGGKA